MDNSLLYKVALSMVSGVGGVLARNLVAYVGSVEGVFNESASKLMKIPGIGEVNARKINDKQVLERAAAELNFIDKYALKVFFYLDDNYPVRFKSCNDAPVLFYFKGNANLDTARVISIVGTRKASDYGRQICDELIHDLATRQNHLLIVSGLAYGIDIQAHKSSLKYNVPTVGVLGHGLDRLYPSAHAKTAKSMIDCGGLLTDFPSETKIDPSNFIRRNRLIAGLADATIVVESGERGGALITANIASSYNRDVFAFPGRVGDTTSKGCNRLIKTNQAALIENVADLEYQLGWESPSAKNISVQQKLFSELKPDEQKIVDLLRSSGKYFIDQIGPEVDLPMNRVSAILLELEFKNVVDALPGKMYRLK